MKRALIAILLVLATLSGAGCMKRRAARLEKPLMNLSVAVRGAAVYGQGQGPLSDAQALDLAYRRNPELQKAFRKYPLYVRHEAKEVVILVCSPNGRFALLEDASWTDPVDRRWYETKTKPKPACAPDRSLVPETPASVKP
jgi:hypothetical protein